LRWDLDRGTAVSIASIAFIKLYFDPLSRRIRRGISSVNARLRRFCRSEFSSLFRCCAKSARNPSKKQLERNKFLLHPGSFYAVRVVVEIHSSAAAAATAAFDEKEERKKKKEKRKKDREREREREKRKRKKKDERRSLMGGMGGQKKGGGKRTRETRENVNQMGYALRPLSRASCSGKISH